MYFWLYQPCAQQTLTSILRTMTREERVIVARSQGILSRVREVSQLFRTACSGAISPAPLSFYLDSYENYILTLNKRCAGFSNGIVRCSGAGGIYRIAFKRAGDWGKERF